MLYRRSLSKVLFCTTLLTGCNQYNVGFRSFYNLETDSYEDAEARIIQLYRHGTFQTNSDSLTKLIGRSIPNFPVNNAQNEWTSDGYRKYRLGSVTKQDFVVYHSESQTYFYYEITNCGGPTGCQIHVNNIVRKDPATSIKEDVQWEDAGPKLQEFEDAILPNILKKLGSGS